MDLWLTSCWDCGPDLLEYYLTSVLIFCAPVGAFLLRRHIAQASGVWKGVGHLLQLFAAVTMLLAVIQVLSILS